jgi:hypothetical protein
MKVFLCFWVLELFTFIFLFTMNKGNVSCISVLLAQTIDMNYDHCLNISHPLMFVI